MKKTKTTKKAASKIGATKSLRNLFGLIVMYFTTRRQFFLVGLVVFIFGLVIGIGGTKLISEQSKPAQTIDKTGYWMVLHRESNVELLYKGVLGNEQKSQLIRTFVVKTGIPGERPTPLHQFVMKPYWLITTKSKSDNPETAPYFLTLDIPVSDEPPFGPKPYEECDGQCNWELPGAFGLHGVNGDMSRLSPENPGSSGCIRHSDEDITYLYELLDPEKEAIRYYVEDR